MEGIRMPLLLLCLFFVFPKVHAQKFDYVARHLYMDDGLSTNVINGIMQDSRGFMWLASDNGLQRYDGNSFVNYHHQYNDSTSIISNKLGFMLEDAKGRIWIQSSEGINVLNPYTNKSFPIKIDDEGGDAANDIINFTKDNKNQVWIITRCRLYLYDYATEKPVLKKALQPDSQEERLWAICFDAKRNYIWLNVHGQITAYNIANGEVYNHLTHPQLVPSIPKHITPIFIGFDNRGDMWIGTIYWELIRYNYSKQKAKCYYVKPVMPNANHFASITNGMLIDRLGNLWIGSNSAGLLKYLPDKDDFEYHTYQDWNRHGMLADDWTNAYTMDREGNIWVASKNANGITIFNPEQSVINMRYNKDRPNYFPQEGACTSTFECRNGKVLVGAWNVGISVYDNVLDNYRPIRYKKNDPSSLGHEFSSVISFAEQKKTGKVWVGCQHACLSLFDPVTEKCRNYSRIPALDNNVIGAIYEATDTTLLLGIWGIPMVKMNTVTEKFTEVKTLSSITKRPIGRVNTFYKNNDREVWLCTSNSGLCRFNIQTETITEAYYPSSNFGSLPDANITCMYKANDSTYLLGSKSCGVIFLNINSRKYQVVDAQKGLPSNTVMGITADRQGNFLVATISSLCRINRQTNAVTVFGTQNQIVISDFINDFTNMKDGRMLVPAWKGVVCFNPDKLYTTVAPFAPTITGFRAINQEIPIDSFLQFKQTIELPYTKNSINIKYASLTYSQTGQVRYLYKLEGIDRDWVIAGRKTEASYTNLDGGNYTFLVKCVNGEGMECVTATSLKIHVQSPFWQKWWFYLICFAGCAAMLYAIYRYRLKQVLKLHQVRSHIANDLHDEVGSTLSGISITSQLLQKMNKENNSLNPDLLQTISTNSQQMLESMSDIVWSINPNNDKLEDILTRMRLFATDMLESKNMEVVFNAPEQVQKLHIPMELRKDIYLIYKEAVNNISKYADATKVVVNLSIIANQLNMEIEDNGKGFELNNIKTLGGNGLRNMQQRAENIKGSLKVVSASNDGTKIILQIFLTTS
mgnify:CR=1 FL=1